MTIQQLIQFILSKDTPALIELGRTWYALALAKTAFKNSEDEFRDGKLNDFRPALIFELEVQNISQDILSYDNEVVSFVRKLQYFMTSQNKYSQGDKLIAFFTEIIPDNDFDLISNLNDKLAILTNCFLTANDEDGCYLFNFQLAVAGKSNKKGSDVDLVPLLLAYGEQSPHEEKTPAVDRSQVLQKVRNIMENQHDIMRIYRLHQLCRSLVSGLQLALLSYRSTCRKGENAVFKLAEKNTDFFRLYRLDYFLTSMQDALCQRDIYKNLRSPAERLNEFETILTAARKIFDKVAESRTDLFFKNMAVRVASVVGLTEQTYNKVFFNQKPPIFYERARAILEEKETKEEAGLTINNDFHPPMSNYSQALYHYDEGTELESLASSFNSRASSVNSRKGNEQKSFPNSFNRSQETELEPLVSSFSKPKK